MPNGYASAEPATEPNGGQCHGATALIGHPHTSASVKAPIHARKALEKGIEEGARVAAGGPGKPAGLDTGYYVKPTVFRDVRNDMTIAREEIFGPVLCMIPYSDVDEAVRIANDTVYGLSGYVYAASAEEAMAVARRLRTGMVHLNGAPNDVQAPFGGYKQSGNGREWGAHGIADFLEVKAVMGAA